MTALIHSNSKMTSRLLPIWLLRMVGYSSLAITLINFVILLCRRSPPTRQTIKTTSPFTIDSYQDEPVQQKSLRRTSSSLADIYYDKSPPVSRSSPSPPYTRTLSPQQKHRWGSRLVDNVLAATSVLKKKKRLTISLKNTILWNPSQDVNVSNHAFHENAIPLLTRLCQRYEVFLLIHTNNEDDHHQIQRLLSPVISPTTQPPLLDKSRLIYCQDEMAKVDLIKNVLCPTIHVEGGWELDDGEDIVRSLHSSSVSKLVWVITRRRRTSFNKENIKSQDQDLLLDTVELTDSLLDTSLAREAGITLDG
ncbi:hypothetical protein BC941DRAFT_434697 [Chlamydoabsidia padenii]|nr:hypothetical protein BC941DRAFT_434697 [Chlamydoabsidia padenii]